MPAQVMDLILALAVFVLAVAVIGLFAMMGELGSRVPASDTDAVPSRLDPIDQARLGGEVDSWPTGLAHLRDADHGLLVVLSTLCTSCGRIASGATGPLSMPTPAAAILVSCPQEAAGAAFVDGNPMVRDHPHALDIGGEWLIRNFNVDISPSVLVFERGRLRSAFTFGSVDALKHLPGVHAEAGVEANAG
ncbi:hypothetical protein AB0C02_30835 [Micromonospora sp. NPDC048999]|uniref:hypothetical protein n=1 Tax=Micromonospora sp. NPDC048999 TaxID=3155391 RepID=UPI0033EE59A9